MDNIRAEQLEHPSEDNGGCDPVHVVIAVNRNALAASDGCEYPIDGELHVRKRHRIVQLLQARIQEPSGTIGIVESALTQEACHHGGNPERVYQGVGSGWITRRGFPFGRDWHQRGLLSASASASALIVSLCLSASTRLQHAET